MNNPTINHNKRHSPRRKTRFTRWAGAIRDGAGASTPTVGDAPDASEDGKMDSLPDGVAGGTPTRRHRREALGNEEIRCCCHSPLHNH